MDDRELWTAEETMGALLAVALHGNLPGIRVIAGTAWGLLSTGSMEDMVLFQGLVIVCRPLFAGALARVKAASVLFGNVAGRGE